MEEIAVDGSSLSWEPATGYPGGTTWKVFRRDSKNNPMTVLLKLPPGFAMDSHSHVFEEHHFVLEGEYVSMGQHYRSESYRVIPAHMEHGPFRSENGAIILIVWESCV